jgi:lipoyl(octanoyl) transferase
LTQSKQEQPSSLIGPAATCRPVGAAAPVAFHTLPGLSPYEPTIRAMEERVAAIRAGQAPETVWFLEHPPLYTAGTSAKPADLLDARFPVYKTGRGGQFTYHGPGQRVAYVMLDLMQRGRDVRCFVHALEQWVILALAQCGVSGERREGRVGVWVVRPDGSEAKIAAAGVRVRHWVTFHGVSINVNPELVNFSGIVPCGLAGFGVTSLQELVTATEMNDLDQALITAWGAVFGAPLDVQSAAAAIS